MGEKLRHGAYPKTQTSLLPSASIPMLLRGYLVWWLASGKPYRTGRV